MILAKGIRTTFNDSSFVSLEQDCNMFILGNLTIDNHNYRGFGTNNGSINNHIIFGPSSVVLLHPFNTITVTKNDVYYIYPGCTIKSTIHTSYHDKSMILNYDGIIYLNRYMNNTSTNLQGTLNCSMKIIYANDNVNFTSVTETKDNKYTSEYTYTDVFQIFIGLVQ